MKRREFLAASLAASAAAVAGQAVGQDAGPAATPQGDAGGREYYQLRRYNLMSGQQLKLTSAYFSAALIPALGRLGLGPAGAFRLEYGEGTPDPILLIAGTDLKTLAEIDLKLAADAEFLDRAAPYWNAASSAPPFERIDTSLLIAFAGWPKLVPPPSSATKAKRIFQLRTYESPSNGEHIRKVEMFHSGEFDYFKAAGCHPVFFGDALAGPRLPCLTYMLSFTDLAALEAGWDAFRNDPGWKKLSSNPRYSYDAIVSNISNLVLSPMECSQI
jgi:NIPSNAP